MDCKNGEILVGQPHKIFPELTFEENEATLNKINHKSRKTHFMVENRPSTALKSTINRENDISWLKIDLPQH